MKVTLELNNMYRVANNIEVLEKVIKTHHNLSPYEVGLLIDTKTILEGIREQTETKQ